MDSGRPVPLTGEHGKMVKYVHRIIDADTHLLKFYDLSVSDGYKVGEITYKRRK